MPLTLSDQGEHFLVTLLHPSRFTSDSGKGATPTVPHATHATLLEPVHDPKRRLPPDLRPRLPSVPYSKTAPALCNRGREMQKPHKKHDPPCAQRVRPGFLPLPSPEVRLRKEFCASFGSSVRVCGFQHVVFEHGLLVVLPFSVDLIGRHVHKPLDAHLHKIRPHARILSGIAQHKIYCRIMRRRRDCVGRRGGGLTPGKGVFATSAE